MSANEIYQWWFFWLMIGTVIVIAAATLLITIIALAHRISALAKIAIDVLLQIETNTKSIWDLNTSKRVAEDLFHGAAAIEENAEAILSTLSKTKDDQAA